MKNFDGITMMTISGMQLFGIWWNTFEVFRNFFMWNLLSWYVEKRFSPPASLMYYSIRKETTPNQAFRVLSSYSKNWCIIRIFSHTRFVRCYLRELLFRKNRKAESVWRFTFKSGSSNILNIYSNKNSWSQRLYIFFEVFGMILLEIWAKCISFMRMVSRLIGAET